MPSSKRFLPALLLAFGVTACSPFKTYSVAEPGVSFTGFHTYTWTAAMQEAIDESTVPSAVRQAVDADLQAKGFQLITSGTPDFRVSYRVQSSLQVSQHIAGEYPSQVSGWFPSIGGSAYLTERNDSLLRVIVYGPTGSRQIWQGYAAAQISTDLSPSERQDVAQRAVRAVLKDFPPK